MPQLWARWLALAVALLLMTGLSGCLEKVKEQQAALELLKQARNGECPGVDGLAELAANRSRAGSLYLASLFEIGPQAGCSARAVQGLRLLERAAAVLAGTPIAQTSGDGGSWVRRRADTGPRPSAPLAREQELLLAARLQAARLLLQATQPEAAASHLAHIQRADAGACGKEAAGLLAAVASSARTPAPLAAPGVRLEVQDCAALPTVARVAESFQRALAGACSALDTLNALAGSAPRAPEARLAAASAAIHLAALWEIGRTSRCDPADQRLVELYEVAAKDFPMAHFNRGLAFLRLGNGGMADQALRLAAQSKCVACAQRAMVKLAQIHEAGQAGLQASAALSAHWYFMASEAGDVHARVRLAQRLLAGVGVPEDGPRALRLLDMAASRGSLEARLMLFRLADGARPSIMRPQPEVAAKWLGSAALLDKTLDTTFEAYLMRLSEPAKDMVRLEIDRFATATQFVWQPVDYDRPLSPNSEGRS